MLDGLGSKGAGLSGSNTPVNTPKPTQRVDGESYSDTAGEYAQGYRSQPVGRAPAQKDNAPMSVLDAMAWNNAIHMLVQNRFSTSPPPSNQT